eukprot:26548-Pelagomonas_calceolata.AAC.2
MFPSLLKFISAAGVLGIAHSSLRFDAEGARCPHAACRSMPTCRAASRNTFSLHASMLACHLTCRAQLASMPCYG